MADIKSSEMMGNDRNENYEELTQIYKQKHNGKCQLFISLQSQNIEKRN